MPMIIKLFAYIQTIYGYHLVFRHVESQIGPPMSGEAATLRKNQNASEGSGMVTAPTVDKRRVIPIDTGCEQRNKKIHIQDQNTFQKFRNGRPKRRTMRHTTMSPPWSYVNGISDRPVRSSHIFKTSTEGRQLCRHARRRMTRA